MLFKCHIFSQKECMDRNLRPIIWLICQCVALGQCIQFQEEWHSGREAARDGWPYNAAPFTNQVAKPIGRSPCRPWAKNADCRL